MDKGTDSYPFQIEKFPSIEDFIKKAKGIDVADQTFDLIDYDLIHPEDPDRILVEKKLKGEEPFSSLAESKAIASFCGTAIGDGIGTFLEGCDINYERNYLEGFENIEDTLKKGDCDFLRCKKGQFTDDTALALCMADSILANNFAINYMDLRYRFYRWFFSGYNNGRAPESDSYDKYSTGIGGATYNTLLSFAKNPKEKVDNWGKGDYNGNGAIMRIAPVPIAFHNNLKKCLHYAKEQAYTTHNGEESSECARLLAFINWHFINSKTPEDCKKVLEDLGSNFKSDKYSVQCLAESKIEDEEHLKEYDPAYTKSIEDRNWNWKDPKFKYSPGRTEANKNLVGIYVMDCTVMALHILYHTSSFKEAVLKAVNLGGDADTVGAVVGTLAGARYGYDDIIKNWYLNYVAKWDEKKCAIRAYKLFKLAEIHNN